MVGGGSGGGSGVIVVHGARACQTGQQLLYTPRHERARVHRLRHDRAGRRPSTARRPPSSRASAPLSFREFQRRVDALAGGLAGLGIGKGDRICVLAQNDTAYLELYGACARQGIIAYPINWRLTARGGGAGGGARRARG